MKKSIALFTALMLCAAMLAGCGGGEKDIAGKTTPIEKAEPAAPKGEVTKPTEAPTPEPTAEPTTEPTPEQEEHELSFGRMEGGIYENSYAGFGCELDSSWTFYGADELQELPDEVREGLEGTEVGDAMEGYPQITDMMAENADMLASVNVLYTKISMAERLAFAMTSEDEIIDTMLGEQRDALAEVYAQMGVNVTAMEKREVTFLGETRTALYTEGELSGVKMYSVQLLDYTRGQYGIALTIQSYLEDSTQNVLDLFYKVEE